MAEQLALSRAFAASAETLWAQFTDPAQLAVWFGPAAFTVPFESVVVELWEGGDWSLSMLETATGDRYPVRGTIRSFEPGRALEIELDSEVGGAHLRLTFSDGLVVLNQGPFSPEERDRTAAGWELSFQKLDAVLDANNRLTA
jgi:uncharacterized protein YndB with AHSA1/START domain